MPPTRHEMLEMHRSHDHLTGVAVVAGKVPTTDGSGGFTYEDGGGSSGEEPFDHGAMGSGETFDLGDSTWHRGTLDDDVTTTIIGFAVDVGVVMLLELQQDGTGGHAITWDADVDFGGADDQPEQAAGTVTFFILWTSTGNSSIFGARVGAGGSGGSALGILDEGVSLDTAVESINFVGDGVVATNVSHAVTVTIDNPVTAATLEALGVVGAILISDDHSTPIVFADILLTEAGDDILYADLGG